MKTAYSYVRFSSKSQAEGDSLARQTERAAEYARRNQLTLDTGLTLRDLGVSAFRGRNALSGNLGVFLDAVKTGRVAPGSTLIVESFDRISRQGIDEGYDLVKGILRAGIRIVTLSPERTFDRDAVRGLSRGALEIQLILERAAEESERKSDRVGAAWARKQANAATAVLTRKLPTWIRYDDDARKLVLVPEPAAVVRRIFKMAREMGMYRIAKRLNAEKVPVVGRAKSWSVNTVANILDSRAAFGEYVPHRGRGRDRRPVGEPVQNYFPAVVTADEFHAVQLAMLHRKQSGRGRGGNATYLFSGMLRDWRDGGTICYKVHHADWGTSLIPVAAANGNGKRCTSFPAGPFEAAILEQLAEVTPGDVADANNAPTRLEALDGRLAELDGLITAWTAKMDNPDIVDTVAAKLAELNATRKELVAERVGARQVAASPSASAWAEFRSLAGMVATGDEDTSLRVRAALRRAIASIDCLFLRAVGRTRLAIVRVNFRSGTTRVYYVMFTPTLVTGTVRTPGRWHARSVPVSGFEIGGPILESHVPPPAAFVERFTAYVTGEGSSSGQIA